MSIRSQTHVTDSKAVKAVIRALPDHWVVRELTERDYGIDLMVEIFLPGKKEKRNLNTFEGSGGLFHIQIKGTEKKIAVEEDGSVSYPMKKSALRYVEKFSVPFFSFPRRRGVSTREDLCGLAAAVHQRCTRYAFSLLARGEEAAHRLDRHPCQ